MTSHLCRYCRQVSDLSPSMTRLADVVTRLTPPSPGGDGMLEARVPGHVGVSENRMGEIIAVPGPIHRPGKPTRRKVSKYGTIWLRLRGPGRVAVPSPPGTAGQAQDVG